jgi:hypothetical protein
MRDWAVEGVARRSSATWAMGPSPCSIWRQTLAWWQPSIAPSGADAPGRGSEDLMTKARC